MSALCLGEVLLDCIGKLRIPGGAPANVACHVASLGDEASLVSRVGADLDGARLTEWLKERKVGADLVQTDMQRPTGTVFVHAGPRYEIDGPAAWDFIELSAAGSDAAARAGVIVFGTLAQRQPLSRKTVRNLVEAARSARVPVLCDLNLRQPYYDEETVLWSLRNCDLLKLNLAELDTVARLLQAKGEPTELFTGLLREFSIPRGVLTCGEEGAWLWENGDLWHQPPAKSDFVADVVGAGDAFTAVIAVALMKGTPLRRAGQAAAELAAYVVSRPGGTPPIPDVHASRINGMLGS